MRAKSFEISKREVFDAWKRVKENRGAAGIDKESLADYEANLSKNLYKLWNRMSSGSYFPPPVKVVEIPKKDKGVRRLGVPSVSDRIAQTVVLQKLEPILEPHFDEDSYGYRRGQSAIQAVGVVRERCWKYAWVLEYDIRGAFDNIDHELLLRALRKHTNCKWILLYIERWLRAPFQWTDGRQQERISGTPQGGVVSPLLMNLFLHYVFDSWMRKHHPGNPFARYADDGVVHCCSEMEAQMLKQALTRRFAECNLELHPDKTQVVHCKTSNRRENYPVVSFTFLGYTFKPRPAKGRDGRYFVSFLPASSRQAIKHVRTQVREKLGKRTNLSIQEVSELLNPTLRGWLNYFKHFYRSSLYYLADWIDRRLVKWVKKKFKLSQGRAVKWLLRFKKREPNFFAHWYMISSTYD